MQVLQTLRIGLRHAGVRSELVSAALIHSPLMKGDLRIRATYKKRIAQSCSNLILAKRFLQNCDASVDHRGPYQSYVMV